ncbi:MAG: 6-bladed beta-propeller [Elusimicrobiota bacterium]|nr:6-bladed beta-propeller [Elusimicrobiota bacterium]
MNRIIFSFIFFALASVSAAYEKVEFKGQILSPAFLKPAAVALSGGKVFVADSKANAVFVFDAAGKQLKKIEGGLKAPEALSFGAGMLYVADTGNSRIAVFDADGKMLWAFSSEGDAPGQLDSPAGIAYGPDDRVYVSNTGNSRIEVFNADGIYLYGFPVAKSDGVTKLEPAKISLSRSGDILVSDPDKDMLQKYDRTGRLLKEYAMANGGAVADRYGRIFAINAKEGKVREVSADGKEIGTFGTKGKGKSEFKNLRDIAIDKSGVLYLCDEENKKVVLIGMVTAHAGPSLPAAAILARFTIKGPSTKFAFKAEVFTVTPDGKIIAWLPEAKEIVLIDGASRKTLIREGKLQGQVRGPRGLFLDKKGRIYVADTGNDRVQIFKPDGTYDNMFGESGSGEGQFRQPSSVAVNSMGNIYVADTKNKKIKAFSADGMFLFAAGPELGNVTLVSPVAVACDENKNVYVLDSVLKKVIVTDAMGKFLRIWDDSGNLQDPASLAYDGKGFFYILDKGSFNVKIFDEAGNFIASFFAKGRGERELWEPQYMAFSGDKIYLSDTGNDKVLSFDISYLPPAPVDLKAEAGEKNVKLSWNAKTNPWTDGFKVYRSTGTEDPEEIGNAQKPFFEDPGLSAEATYYYFVAGLSATGVIGGLSEPAGAYFKLPEAPVAAAAETGTAPADAVNKNVAPMEILAPELSYIFSANYKYYQKNPVGKIAVKNNTDSDFTNVKLSFFFKDFMDFPSDTIVEAVKAHSQTDVPLSATLNNRILNINEDTPIQCQLTLTYYQDGVEKTATLNKPVKVLSKNAIVWDNSARLANFITVKDTPVSTFRSFALLEKKNFEAEATLLDESVLTALMVWEGLGEFGLTYLADPVNPYSVLKSTQNLVLDTVQFPRNTLKLKSGDCDDLTALFASIFEASGLHVALLDFPGHIALMYDTGKTDANLVGLPEDYLIKYNNTWWVGVETTMVGKSFQDSVLHIADLYRKSEKEVKVIDVRASWNEFEPVTLPETEAETYASAALSARIKEALSTLMAARYEHLKKFYGRILQEVPGDIETNLSLGIVHAEYKAYDEAAGCFGKVLEKEPFNAGALNNMGNLSFTGGKYAEAKDYYFKATKADPFDGNIWLNLARVSDKLGKKEDVKIFAEKAAKIEPELKSIGDKLSK